MVSTRENSTNDKTHLVLGWRSPAALLRIFYYIFHDLTSVTSLKRVKRISMRCRVVESS